MKAKELYEKLEKDFEIDKCSDDWERMNFNEFIYKDFKKRYIGLVLDNSKEIKKVYTAVFPSDNILNKILKKGEENILLFTHHPMIWDIRKAPRTFTDINIKLLPKLKEKRISVYTLHVPLDKNGKYSTSVTLAKTLGIKPEHEILDYFGIKAGIVGKGKYDTVEELKEKISSIVGHKVKLWGYGDEKIKNNMVAFVAGGGNRIDALKDIKRLGANVLVTGVTLKNKHSKEAHEFAKENKINLIGATHYSTEKFTCIAMCGYFKKLNLDCEFIEDIPVLEDMG